MSDKRTYVAPVVMQVAGVLLEEDFLQGASNIGYVLATGHDYGLEIENHDNWTLD